MLLLLLLACGRPTPSDLPWGGAGVEGDSGDSAPADTGAADTGAADTGAADTGAEETGSVDTADSEDTAAADHWVLYAVRHAEKESKETTPRSPKRAPRAPWRWPRD